MADPWDEEVARWERAADVAWARGCTPENPCWADCVEAALDDPD